jgi:hypothetical protein
MIEILYKILTETNINKNNILKTMDEILNNKFQETTLISSLFEK